MFTCVEIYYYRSDAKSVNKFILGDVSILDIASEGNYLKVYELHVDPHQEIHVMLEKVFKRFNSRDNPLIMSEHQEFLRSNRLHTSMSVGDVVMLNRRAYVVTGLGFRMV